MPLVIAADRLGPSENYELRHQALPPLGAGQVRVAIINVAVGFVDVLIARGGYQITPSLPYVPGSEAVGQIVALGADVSGMTVGDRVIVTALGGLFAQEVVVPATALMPCPVQISDAQAAALPTSYTTAWHALIDRGTLKAGEIVLVLGAAGAVGLAAIEIARHAGARVIASASTAAKRALATKAGADASVEARAANWREQIREASGGQAIDVVVDPVGGDATDAAFRTLDWGGRHLVIGFPAGIAALRTNLPLLKGASLVGVDVRKFAEREPEQARANQAEILRLAGQGVLCPRVGCIYPIDDFRLAMDDAFDGQTAGRVIIDMRG